MEDLEHRYQAELTKRLRDDTEDPVRETEARQAIMRDCYREFFMEPSVHNDLPVYPTAQTKLTRQEYVDQLPHTD